MKREMNKFRAFLKAHHLKLTRARKLVFEEILSSASVHPNASELRQRLSKKGQRVSLATIYRTLNLLVRSGLVSSIDLGENHSHFEPEKTGTSHGHLICLRCGRVCEFSQDEIGKFIGRVGQDKGYHLDKFSIQVFGFCEKCRNA